MKDYAMYIGSLLIFGTNGVIAALIDMSSAEIVCMRTLVGSAALILVLLISRAKLDWTAMRREAPKLLAAGVCLGVNWALLFEAYKLMSVSMATLTYYLAPVLVLLLSPVLLREKQHARAYVGMLAAVVGLALAVGVGDTGVTGRGLAVGLGSALFYAALIVFNKKINGVSGLPLTVIEMVVAACVMLPYVLLTGGRVGFPPDALGTGALVFLCLVNTGLACFMYFSSMNRLPARAVALFGYVDPVSALIFSAIFLHDRLGLLQILGAVLVFAGAAWGQSQPKQARTLTGGRQ